MTNLIVLYDGVCGLCNGLVQFLLKQDKNDKLRFASLQSKFASQLLTRHGINPNDLDTLHLVENFEHDDERVLNRSDAILRAAGELGGLWSLAATVGKFVPRAIRDRFYRFVATNRYRVFGKYESCMLPEPNQRSKFLDMADK